MNWDGLMEKKDISSEEELFLFPKWTNGVPLILALSAVIGLCTVVFVFWYWFSPKNFNIGFAPEQPIEYSHELHAGQLGIDCRYCHVNVDKGPAATLPSTEICMNCHSVVKTNSKEILKIRESFSEGKKIEWEQIHRLPGYSYFDHSQHVNSGVSCVSCHGRVDLMERVYQVEPLSMGWCLECHRNPAKNIRPKKYVTDLSWKTENPEQLGKELIKKYHINPREDCSACHR